MEMGKFAGVGFDEENCETGRKGGRGAEDDQWEMEMELEGMAAWRSGGGSGDARDGSIANKYWRRGAAAAQCRAAVAAAANLAMSSWPGQGVAAAAAAAQRRAAAAVDSFPGLL